MSCMLSIESRCERRNGYRGILSIVGSARGYRYVRLFDEVYTTNPNMVLGVTELYSVWRVYNGADWVGDAGAEGA
jgi:hypothetical protein